MVSQCHGITMPWYHNAMVSQMPWYHKCHGITHAMVSHMPWYHTCHGITHAMVSHMPWYHTCHGITHAMVSHMPWYHTCHGITHAMVSHMPWYHNGMVPQCCHQMQKHLKHHFSDFHFYARLGFPGPPLHIRGTEIIGSRLFYVKLMEIITTERGNEF